MDRAAQRRLGRSLAIREVDAGSCNGCELEIHALNNAFNAYPVDLASLYMLSVRVMEGVRAHGPTRLPAHLG